MWLVIMTPAVSAPSRARFAASHHGWVACPRIATVAVPHNKAAVVSSTDHGGGNGLDLGCGGIGREDVTTECVGGTTVCFGNEIDFRIVPFNRTARQSSIGLFFDRPGRREAAYRHGCCLMQNKINDLNLLYD
jgi:hypothetical protein